MLERWIRESETVDEAGACRSAAQRLADALGLVCLVAALVLSLSGVRIARADDAGSGARIAPVDDAGSGARIAPVDDAAEANMSIDPALATEIEAAKAERPRAIARPGGPAELPELPPGVAAVEIAPGVVRLNTRGYNYRSAAGDVDLPPARPVAPTAPAAPAPAAPAD